MTAWIMTVDDYHSESPEDPEVYHDGFWLCPEGGRIYARHLAKGKGDPPRRRCEVCANEPETARALMRKVNESRERRGQ